MGYFKDEEDAVRTGIDCLESLLASFQDRGEQIEKLEAKVDDLKNQLEEAEAEVERLKQMAAEEIIREIGVKVLSQ